MNEWAQYQHAEQLGRQMNTHTIKEGKDIFLGARERESLCPDEVDIVAFRLG